MLMRCQWCGSDPLYIDYHDNEWGVPQTDDQALFAMLCLEGMQAGLSWLTILKRRPHLNHAFANFIPEHLARFTAADIQRLAQDARIIRHTGKIAAMVQNARAYLNLMPQQSFSRSVWQFTEGLVLQHHYQNAHPLPVTSPQAQAMAKWLKARGFQFVGDRICYAFMQAAGMVNDHVVECFRHRALAG